MTLVHPWALVLLLALPACVWLLDWADKQRWEARRRFALRPGVASRANAALLLTAMALTIVAIAQPMGRDQTGASKSAGDIVFLLDVSRSMATRDGVESRLAQARAAIAEVMRRAADQRFALVVFAGNASIECPLTNDYAFLRDQLKLASRESATLGGTRIGDALRFAAQSAFDDASRNTRELVLIGDGGDDGSSPVSAAEELDQHGVRLVVIGVGEPSNPGYVPVSETDQAPYLYRGKPIRTALDSTTLKKICAGSPGCRYARLGEGAVDQTVLESKSIVSRMGTGAASMAGSLLALSAAGLLAWDCVSRRRRT